MADTTAHQANGNHPSNHGRKPGKRARSGSLTPKASSANLGIDARRHQQAQGTSSSSPSQSGSDGASGNLASLPLEILAEVLTQVSSPADILAVARTCRFLHRTLGKPSSAFIWRTVRESMRPNPMPAVPPPSSSGDALDQLAHIRSEPTLAAFVYDAKPCHECEKLCNGYRRSFSLNMRLCDSTACRDQFTGRVALMDGLTVVEAPGDPVQLKVLSWFMRAETTSWPRADASHVHPMLHYWPQSSTALVSVEWADSLRAYRAAAADGTLADYIAAQEVKTSSIKAALTFYVQLHKWWIIRLSALQTCQRNNRALINQLGTKHGWDPAALIRSATFGRIVKLRDLDLQPILEQDLVMHKDQIAKELLHTKNKTQNSRKKEWDTSIAEALERAHNRVRSAGGTVIAPTFPAFMKLPVIASLTTTTPSLKQAQDKQIEAPRIFGIQPVKDKAKKTIDLAKRLRTSSDLEALIDDQVRQWVIQARDALLPVLGLLPRWQTANLKVVHPVERVTGRFLCRYCRDADPRNARTTEPGEDMQVDVEGDGQGEKIVAGPSRVHGLAAWKSSAMDFKEVCGHECPCLSRQQKQELEARGGWDANMFVRDDKAITALNQVLEAHELDPASRDTEKLLRGWGHAYLCLSCDAPIIMPFASIPEHAHRHDKMEVTYARSHDYVLLLPRPLEIGLAKKLLAENKTARHFQSLKIYGCRWCYQTSTMNKITAANSQKDAAGPTGPSTSAAASGSTSTVVASAASNAPLGGGGAAAPSVEHQESTGIQPKKKNKKQGKGKGKDTGEAREQKYFNFNGMRSHLKAKHGVELIRDEDFYCQKVLDWKAGTA
ncbi:hypothetical protein HGRIS_011635 [Hohenbuehelia grisea]|uniref:F-box domain-containing protein n=1 Tax=Hohenbuehelia grisea TaxID=104357 RepID=A0ABR3JVP6_9AGAR